MRSIPAVEDNKRAFSKSFLAAYFSWKRSEKELLDFDEAIFTRDIPALAAELDFVGITQFTVSARQANMAFILTEFSEHGWRLAGLTRVKAGWSERSKKWWLEAAFLVERVKDPM